MGSGGWSIDHDRFVNKNRSMARGFEVETRDSKMEGKGYSFLKRRQEASCFQCKRKSKCIEFRSRRTGGSKGVVSFGGDETFICDRFEPAPAQQRGMSDKQIKALMKNVKRGF
jgi:hypothetical protein